MVQYYTFVEQNKQEMAGRPKIYDEERALDRAVGVFWEKGYANASADDLLKAMGIGKGSFYLAFKGGKQELFEKSMKRVVDQNFRELRSAIHACDNPVKLIKDFFLGLVGEQSPIGNQGCYFGNALVQISENDSGLKLLAAHYLTLLESIFEEAMQRGKDLGLLQTNLPPATLASYLINLWNGINVTRRMETDSAKLAELLKLNLAVIE
ncbi:TetR/AcrR family transcriptional regulator [Siphonobacter sp. SORGH_AS_1065]|uniref:TetR/AcrR family transcriptional regulator n=1 Tax=Siphonobacter sp. SORGH_AS_1065 TaxID=3041795 RepID=UPI0027843409|nr:TetR/AcrR family transcriptional regulator [Siphonobacter sp. SORGH_AS_1065]MDQ1090136.1 TetR/AcrR family transcriptional repressor of nem operon [Siphonobacter sp. SORGH_AS_1065]